MDEAEDLTQPLYNDEAELKELLGMFDVPAFARRGFDLEYALKRLHDRLARERHGMLDMVRIRLKQWAGLATGLDDWRDVYKASIAALYTFADADPPRWAPRTAPNRPRLVVARDLVTSVDRFNRRWLHALDTLKLDSINRQVEHYNLYYLLEKECVLGSARLAQQNFVPQPLLNREVLLSDHPTLPFPELIA